MTVPWPEPGVARPLRRCAVLELRHDDGRYMRRWCEGHARLYDREVAEAGPAKVLPIR
jgi:hypothetical protein